jgi:hypothetical protein
MLNGDSVGIERFQLSKESEVTAPDDEWPIHPDNEWPVRLDPEAQKALYVPDRLRVLLHHRLLRTTVHRR